MSDTAFTNVTAAVTKEPTSREISRAARREIIKAAGVAGKATAAGCDALPGLAREVVLAASKGFLSLARERGDNARDGGRDDAARIYAAYAHAREQGATLDIGGGGGHASRRVQTSKVRQLIKMGMGPGDPIAVIDQVVQAHQHAVCGGKSVRDLYGVMVSVARSQLKAGRDLSKDEIVNEVCKAKSTPLNPTVPLVAIDHALTELIDSGESSPEVSKARGLIRRRLMVLRNISEPSHSNDLVTLEPEEWSSTGPVAPAPVTAEAVA